MAPKITVTRTGPGAKQLQTRLNAIHRMEVFVGIPQAKNSRAGEPIGNAALLYIHTHGSPLRNLPARPVIEPAIAAQGNKQAISSELKEAARAHLAGDVSKAQTYLKRAGTAGSNASKAWFTDARNNWAPNSPETIRRKGSNRPLIDTGALRRAIVSVIRP
jgi:hypothetical protein